MTHTVKTEWKQGIAFEADIDGHAVSMDADPKFGGTGQGPSPKKLLLAGLTGCTGMDVVSLLRKMKVPFDRFSIQAEAESSDEDPVVYTKIKLVYSLWGRDLDGEKIAKAVKLSQEKYCGVSAMLGKTAEITYEILSNPA